MATEQSEAEENKFLEDTLELFQGSRSGHMNSHAFSEPCHVSDPVRGGEYWTSFISKSKDYYLISEEAALIASFAGELAGRIPPKSSCMDLGPGEETAVVKKTLPLLKALRQPRAYIPVDVNSSFVAGALMAIRRETDIPCFGMVADFLREPLHVWPQGPRLAILFGGLLCNLGKGRKSALAKLSENLSMIRALLNPGDFFLITQDTNRDPDILRKSYTHPDLGRYVMTVMHKIKRDLATDDFDPENFEFYSEWIESEDLEVLGARAIRPMSFKIENRDFSVARNQKIPLVNSYKFSVEQFLLASRQAGFSCVETYRGASTSIALHLLQA